MKAGKVSKLSINSVKITQLYTYETMYGLLIKSDMLSLSEDSPTQSYHIIFIDIEDISSIQTPKGIISIMLKNMHDIFVHNTITIMKNDTKEITINDKYINYKEIMSILDVLKRDNEEGEEVVYD